MYFKEQVMTGRLAVPMFTVSICRTLHKRKFQTPFSNTLGKLLIKRVRFKIILSKLAGCVALVSSAGCHSEQVYFAVCFLYINPSLLWLGSALQFNLDYLYSKKRASTLSNKLKHVQPVKCKPRFTIIKDNKTVSPWFPQAAFKLGEAKKADHNIMFMQPFNISVKAKQNNNI